MEIENISSVVFTYGGTVVMAVLFVFMFFWLINKLNKTLEENSKLLSCLVESNNNIASALELLKNGCDKIEDKIDRNYEQVKYGGVDK